MSVRVDVSEGLPSTSLFEQIRQVSSRRRRILALAVGVPLAGVLGFALFVPRSYRSTAIVVVDRAGVSDDDVDARLSVLQSENSSRSRLRALVERYDLYRWMEPDASIELMVDQMTKDIHIELDREERSGRSVVAAVHVTYTAPDPLVAAVVANDLASFFEREDLRMREERSNQTRQNLQEQLADARLRLDEQETRLADYKKRHLNELPEQVGLHLSALARLNSQIRASQIEPASSRRSAPATRRPRATERDERFERLRELSARFTEEHPDVKRLRREIAATPYVPEAPFDDPTEAVDATEAAAGTDGRHRIEGIRQTVATLKQTAAAHERGILNAPFRQQELDALLPDYVAARTRYQSLWERYEIAQLWDPRHDGGRLRVLDRAAPRDEAVAPNVLRIAAMGIAMSLAAAVGMLVAVERMDTSFHTVDDLRAFTRIPVLARVPRLVSSTDKRRDAHGTRRFVAIALLIVACVLLGAAYLGRGNQALVTWMAQRSS